MARFLSRRRNTLSALLFTLLLLTSPVAAKDSAGNKKADPAEEYYELFEIFADSLDQIERNYVREIDRRDLVEAAIKGMIKELDQHSSYINPEEVEQFRTSVESRFGGIGIHVSNANGQLTVVSPLVGAPAYKVGVLPGDQIVEIEGESTEGITLNEAVRKLKGEVGTKVTITVRQGDKGERREVTITRDIVRVETVLGHKRNTDDSWDFMYDDDQHIGYVRLNSFSRDTANDLRKALKSLQKSKLRGLVLDLRFNPGGLLTSAIEISDLFVKDGTIVSTKGRNVRERIWNAKASGTFLGFPMVVLVNRYSASASEIVSACLQDHDRAIVVGERSFGKGSVQNVIELEEGQSVLKLTTASYWRPSGKNIHRFPDAKDSDEWGVKPDDGYDLRMTDEELRGLVESRRNDYVTHGKRPKPEASGDKADDAGDQAKADVDKAEDAFRDRQLEKALEYLSTEIARAG